DANLKFSPDGKWIAYSATSDPKSWTAKTDIQIIAVSGGTPHNLTRDFIESAIRFNWSSDGKTIYFASAIGVYLHLFSVPVSGGTVSQITEGKRNYGQYAISNDGKIVCVVNDNRHAPELYILSRGDKAGYQVSTSLQLSSANPQLDKFAIAQTEVIKWK